MLNRQEIQDKLYQLLDEVNAFEISENGNKVLLENMDSIQLISFIVEVEECFGIEIPDEYLVTEFFKNEEQIIDVVEQLLKCETDS